MKVVGRPLGIGGCPVGAEEAFRETRRLAGAKILPEGAKASRVTM